ILSTRPAAEWRTNRATSYASSLRAGPLARTDYPPRELARQHGHHYADIHDSPQASDAERPPRGARTHRTRPLGPLTCCLPTSPVAGLKELHQIQRHAL